MDPTDLLKPDDKDQMIVIRGWSPQDIITILMYEEVTKASSAINPEIRDRKAYEDAIRTGKGPKRVLEEMIAVLSFDRGMFSRDQHYLIDDADRLIRKITDSMDDRINRVFSMDY